MQQKIVLVGGPGTGKSTVLNKLLDLGYTCLEEVSREVTLKAQKEGIDQLFLEKPLLFSELLLEGRIEQYKAADSLNENPIFIDRGIPDVEAYLTYFNTDFPTVFSESSKKYRYDYIFYFQPWEEIYQSDNERYETFEQSQEISKSLVATYQKYGYNLINVPFGTVQERVDFILNAIS